MSKTMHTLLLPKQYKDNIKFIKEEKTINQHNGFYEIRIIVGVKYHFLYKNKPAQFDKVFKNGFKIMTKDIETWRYNDEGRNKIIESYSDYTDFIGLLENIPNIQTTIPGFNNECVAYLIKDFNENPKYRVFMDDWVLDSY